MPVCYDPAPMPGRNSLSASLMRMPVPWVFVLAYLIGVALEYLVPLDVHPSLPIDVGVIGAVLFGIGAIIAGWAWLIFRRAGTTRVPGEASTTLVTWGPYHLSRNPMYVGLATAYLGEAGLLSQLWPAIVLPFVLAYLNWVVIPVEEARLRDVFDGEYDRYGARVRRWV
jgi:protein-S-isoprenylcysteine O-methyltransferase Ste14